MKPEEIGRSKRHAILKCKALTRTLSRAWDFPVLTSFPIVRSMRCEIASMPANHRRLRNLALVFNIIATVMTLITYNVGPSRKMMLIAGCVYWLLAIPIFIRRWHTMTLPILYFLAFGQVVLSIVLAVIFARPTVPIAP